MIALVSKYRAIEGTQPYSLPTTNIAFMSRFTEFSPFVPRRPYVALSRSQSLKSIDSTAFGQAAQWVLFCYYCCYQVKHTKQSYTVKIKRDRKNNNSQDSLVTALRMAKRTRSTGIEASYPSCPSTYTTIYGSAAREVNVGLLTIWKTAPRDDDSDANEGDENDEMEEGGKSGPE